MHVAFLISLNSLFSIWFLSFLITIFKNPGIPSKDNYLSKEKRETIESTANEDGYLSCNICNVAVKNDIKISHCLTCNICIYGKINYKKGYDHHCGWSSKCIGEGNIFSFQIFLISTFILFCYYITIFIIFQTSR